MDTVVNNDSLPTPTPHIVAEWSVIDMELGVRVARGSRSYEVFLQRDGYWILHSEHESFGKAVVMVARLMFEMSDLLNVGQ